MISLCSALMASHNFLNGKTSQVSHGPNLLLACVLVLTLLKGQPHRHNVPFILKIDLLTSILFLITFIIYVSLRRPILGFIIDEDESF